jgi:hypothetical protein
LISAGCKPEPSSEICAGDPGPSRRTRPIRYQAVETTSNFYKAHAHLFSRVRRRGGYDVNPSAAKNRGRAATVAASVKHVEPIIFNSSGLRWRG